MASVTPPLNWIASTLERLGGRWSQGALAFHDREQQAGGTLPGLPREGPVGQTAGDIRRGNVQICYTAPGHRAYLPRRHTCARVLRASTASPRYPLGVLTGDLVRIRWTRDGLKCGFIDAGNARLLEKATAVLTAFEEHIGASRGALDEALHEVEGDGVDHKLTRGLAKLCLDRAEFDTTAPMPPADLRRAVFSLAARIGPLRTAEVPVDAGGVGGMAGGADAPPTTAASVWQALAAELGLSAKALSAALYADLPAEQTLIAVDIPTPVWLLHRYNVALVQAALVHARSVTVTLGTPGPGEIRALLRAVKFHQLLAEIRPSSDGGYTLHIDGPASLFSQTTRYGLALARFFPAILLLTSPWNMRAQVAWRQRTTPIEINHETGLVSHYKAQGTWRSREAVWFHERWTETVPAWRIEEGGLPLDQGGEGMVVPDFTLTHADDDRPVHIEILGYWRKGSLKRRLELTARHGPDRLILAVSRKLMQADPDDNGEPPEGVVLFSETVPVKEVLRMAEAMRAKPRAKPRA